MKTKRRFGKKAEMLMIGKCPKCKKSMIIWLPLADGGYVAKGVEIGCRCDLCGYTFRYTTKGTEIGD